MRIVAAAYENFPPFADAVVEFPECESAKAKKRAEVHFLTGENGTGKTRFLSLLAAACGNGQELEKRWLGVDSRVLIHEKKKNIYVVSSKENSALVHEKNIIYQKDLSSKLVLNTKTIDIAKQFNHISMAFSGSVKINDIPMNSEPTFNTHFNPVDEKFILQLEKNIPNQNTLNSILRDTITKLIVLSGFEMYRYGPSANTRSIGILRKLESVIQQVTRKKFSFDIGSINNFDFLARWGDTPIRLSHLPDGLRSILGWLGLCISILVANFPDVENIFEYNLILLLDEPELHLHPAWQRKILPATQLMFPNAQIFVATHSPFIISSVNEGWIHCFRADEKNVVKIDEPLACEQGDSWIDVVENILGVREWYDPETEDLLTKLRSKKDEVYQNPSKVGEFRELANIIAKRGEALDSIMSREVKQLERNLAAKEKLPA